MSGSPARVVGGQSLYGIVEAYAAFGDHHTGTAADRATTDWLVGVLGAMGASVEREPFVFDRYVATAELTVGGDPVPCVPVFYSAVGHWTGSNPEIIEVDPGVAGGAHGFDPFLASCSAPTAALAVQGPDDLVVQGNRAPEVGSGPPAVVVPGNWADRLTGEEAKLEFSATTEPSTSENLVARLGPDGAPAVTITTPLTGWTPCAGERGTGLAAALALMADLAVDHRVELVGCAGHELDHVGLQHHLDRRDVTGEQVIHLGASVGAVEWDTAGRASLGRRRQVLSTAADDLRPAIAERVAAGNWRLNEVDDWPGEGGNWQRAGASVLSFLGGFSLFHTGGDVPAAATTPAALELATSVVIDSARLFLGASKPLGLAD